MPKSHINSIRLTTAEVMASAVCDLFPQTQLVAVHVTQEGFFSDFVTQQPINEQALPLIEEKMRGIIKADLPIEMREMMRENAAELFRHLHLPLQAEQALIAQDVTVLVMHLGKFCSMIPLDGPPVLESTGGCRAFKIQEITRESIYNESRGEYPVLRIRGTACEDLQALKQWLKVIKAAQKRDHRLLGQQMQLFRPADALCPGCWSWLPRGFELREALLDFWKNEVRSAGYQIVSTPALLVDDSASMEIEGNFYRCLPDRATAHASLFDEGGFQNLPIRFAECADFYEPIPREELEGLFKTRLQTVDALHLFCAPQQAIDACISSLQFFNKTLKILSFEPYWVLVDSRPVHSPVRQADWRQAVQLLTQALEGTGIQTERVSQPAGMYGPLLEMRLSDSLGRKWAVASLGVDEYLPRQMGLSFRTAERKEQAPVMLRGSLFGSVERLVALLLENGVDINRVLRRAKPES